MPTPAPTTLTQQEHRLLKLMSEAQIAYDIIPDSPSAPTTPIQRMQLAALIDAVRVLAAARTTAQFTYDVWWINGRRPSAPGFSLRDICESLELDHDKLWKHLNALAERALREPAARRRVTSPAKQRRLKIVAA